MVVVSLDIFETFANSSNSYVKLSRIEERERERERERRVMIELGSNQVKGRSYQVRLK